MYVCVYMCFCTGNKFWVFKDTTLQPGYPHDLITLGSGIPSHGIDSAIWWEDVGKTYFFKGDRLVQEFCKEAIWWLSAKPVTIFLYFSKEEVSQAT